MIPPQIEEGCASCNPSGVGVEMGRGTRGCFAPRATGFNASGVLRRHDHGLQVAEPAMTSFIQDLTESESVSFPHPAGI